VSTLTQIVSYSIHLKNLPVDPNTLAMWDDGLVEAWKDEERLTLLMRVNGYPPSLDHAHFYVGLGKNCKSRMYLSDVR
jgi:ubiquitin-conjugating enzyme E2 Q